jgi:ferritin
MTKHFKKTRNFDTKRFVQDFEKEMIEEEEGDIFTLTGLERARDGDEISDIEEGFMAGYLEA